MPHHAMQIEDPGHIVEIVDSQSREDDHDHHQMIELDQLPAQPKE